MGEADLEDDAYCDHDVYDDDDDDERGREELTVPPCIMNLSQVILRVWSAGT